MLRAAAAAFQSIAFDNASDTVNLTLRDGSCCSVCREWVVDNCISRRHATGQKTRSSSLAACPHLDIARAVIVEAAFTSQTASMRM